jgi:hypothetical protein
MFEASAMKNFKLGLLVLLLVAVAVPSLGKTYKYAYSVACGDIWPAVHQVLSVPEDYTVIENDDAKMSATYDVKHSAHVNVSGALLQRKNKVTLVPASSGCQMQVVSNYSGWEHHDQGDFKDRVDAAMTKAKAAPPVAPVPAKPAEPPITSGK